MKEVQEEGLTLQVVAIGGVTSMPAILTAVWLFNEVFTLSFGVWVGMSELSFIPLVIYLFYFLFLLVPCRESMIDGAVSLQDRD